MEFEFGRESVWVEGDCGRFGSDEWDEWWVVGECMWDRIGVVGVVGYGGCVGLWGLEVCGGSLGDGCRLLVDY